ncbi:hypothetical protein [Mesorhizobium sp. Z1-4]|uniref:hypothetical protein n=1 Tax=Mesorhizobium sp. Z1-4 TaxID=2448478 RepID=UPI000FDB8572|nr:hypothetical protein [Mesorhizobium sp. Z1-4]
MSFFTEDQAAILAGREVRAAWLAQAEFKSETKRLWAGNTVLDANGYEWQPTYGAVVPDDLGWVGEPVSRQISFRLSGIGLDLVTLALAETEEADQQPITVYMLFMDETWAPVGSPVPVFAGLMQPPKVSRGEIDGLDGAEMSVVLTAENLFFNRAKPPNGRYTSSDQAKRVGWVDKFFNYTPLLVNRTFRWPIF